MLPGYSKFILNLKYNMTFLLNIYLEFIINRKKKQKKNFLT